MRIIGGHWRGTRLPVIDRPGLRPTGDRVRETLFNWLAPVLAGARCADLFAGTGALGLEAASRGAATVVLVERDRAVCSRLRETVQRLDAGDRVSVIEAAAADWLAAAPPGSLDLAFVDPPFDSDVHGEIVERLLAGPLSPAGWIYLESPRDRIPEVPSGLSVHRQREIGEVCATLIRAAG